MGTPCVSQATARTSADDVALRERQGVRRRRLGTLLIVLGSVWLCLRLTGWIGDAPEPLIWVQWVLAPELRVTRSRFAQSILQVAGAVLALDGLRRVWVSYAEQ